MIRLFILFFFLIVTLVSCNKVQKADSIKISSLPVVKYIGEPIDTVLASSPVVIKYTINNKIEGITLEVSNSLSSTLVLPKKNKAGILEYFIDEMYTQKAGVLSCNLVHKGQILDTKQITILPQKKTINLETYLGPSYISTLPNDYAMLVSIPFDKYDNPNMKPLQVQTLNNTILKEQDPIAVDIVNYDIIPSKKKSGKLFIKVKNEDISSKRLELAIRPSFAQNFMIEYRQNNNIADGKELTSVTTSQIKDVYGNVIANGSLVRFRIQDANTSYFGYAKTINGVAVYKMVHPKKPKSISIQAFIEGFAKSNYIELNYVAHVF
ncbi:hypothetical protein [Pseudofulvibacter geojedonensis]|uniref:Lipoprotein n=1 Tax=Pseudofulvibacter geojedonensis TaxID=1123758 RepID=A0ABW3I5D5_9FLAO